MSYNISFKAHLKPADCIDVFGFGGCLNLRIFTLFVNNLQILSVIIKCNGFLVLKWMTGLTSSI